MLFSAGVNRICDPLWLFKAVTRNDCEKAMQAQEQDRDDHGRVRPVISVIMANYCGDPHIDAAIRAVRGQTLENIELLISDDASPDDSLAVARRHAAEDNRVRVFEAPFNAGPGVARNRALDAARGDWVAIVDSDDLIHPQRLQRMLTAAGALGVDMIADDLVLFGDSPSACGRTLLQDLALSAPLAVDTSLLLRANGGDDHVPPLGYLKPLIRSATLGSLRYDETLRIGEDFDLCLRLLLGGARYALLPDPMYLYRRHSGSISYRLSLPVVEAMIAAHDRLPPPGDAAEARERQRWRDDLTEQRRFEALVASLKGRRLAEALPLMASPAMLRRLAQSVAERASRRHEQSIAVSDATLHLSGEPADEVPLSVAFPAPPEAGAGWPSPPATAAAALSALSARHRLTVVCRDEPGDWARWLLPAAYAR